MIYKLILDESGIYSKDNVNYTLLEATFYIDTPEGRNIDCVEFDNITQAENHFGIVKNNYELS